MGHTVLYLYITEMLDVGKGKRYIVSIYGLSFCVAFNSELW